MNVEKIAQDLLSDSSPDKKSICDALDDAHKRGWDEAIEAAYDLMSTGAGVDADYLKEQLSTKDS